MDPSILVTFAPLGGKVGFYFKDLATGEIFEKNGEMPLLAASVIKLPVMAEAFRQMEAGLVGRAERFAIRPEDKLPGCGALNELHDGLEVTFLDLVKLMIVLSDNTATNLVIRRLGMDAVNAYLTALGLAGTRLNRLLFDAEASARGIENRVSAADMGRLLEMIWRGELVSKEASAEMLGILFAQRLGGKLPLSLPRHVDVANKTGEDEGITNDVGL
ncbi:MAG TPA: serine hydrolase, partial [Clostridia bacterium]|nr:serine hydrolase [Clostridia bacterium]